jgi:hypothetical protein
MVEGATRGFNHHSPDEKRQIIAAIAAVNSLPTSIIFGQLRVASWLERPQEYPMGRRFAGKSASELSEWGEAYRRTVKIRDGREAIYRRLEALGQSYLSHNDMPGSFIVPPEGDVILFDWEAATLNVAGADLAFTVGRRADNDVVSYYISEMAERGFRLKEADVRFAMEVLRGFLLLRRGWKRHSTEKINGALELLAPYDNSSPSTSQIGQTAGGVHPDSVAPGPALKAPSEDLIRAIRSQAERKKGAVYACVPHPAFSDVPYRYGPERFDMLIPHLDYRGGTALDIGANWGYTSHRLEDLGYHVTAVELDKQNVTIMTQLRDLCGKKFRIVEGSIFNLQDCDYDLVIAQNIFHHFLKKEATFAEFDAFIGRLNCRMMIYQAHSSVEKQMDGAYRGMDAEEMARFLSTKLSLPNISCIGIYGRRNRKLFRLAA